MQIATNSEYIVSNWIVKENNFFLVEYCALDKYNIVLESIRLDIWQENNQFQVKPFEPEFKPTEKILGAVWSETQNRLALKWDELPPEHHFLFTTYRYSVTDYKINWKRLGF